MSPITFSSPVRADAVLGFQHPQDALNCQASLSRRLEKFGLKRACT
ncbi:hypothetical protein [Xenorhabdus sp. SGI240]